MTTDDLDRIISRVKKLEALQGSPNEAEAALAAARVQEMLVKYNLEWRQVQEHRGQDTYTKDRLDVDPDKRQTKSRQVQVEWKKDLLNGLCEYNFCKCIFHDSNTRGGVAATWGARMSIVGQPHNIEVVKALYSFLSSEIERLAELGWLKLYLATYTRGEGSSAAHEHSSRVWKKSFKVAAGRTVLERLRQQRKHDEAVSSDTQALVVVTGTELREATDRIFPNLKSRMSRDDGRYDRAGMIAGQQAGRAIPINKMVREDNADQRLALR